MKLPPRAAAPSASRPSFRVSARTSADPRAAPGPRLCPQPPRTRGPSGAAAWRREPSPSPAGSAGNGARRPFRRQEPLVSPVVRLPRARLWAACPRQGRDARRARAGRGHPLPRPGRGRTAPSALASPPEAPPRAPSRSPSTLFPSPPNPVPSSSPQRWAGKGPQAEERTPTSPGCWKLWNLGPRPRSPLRPGASGPRICKHSQ